ncbi:MAG TPA: universal stress protein [Candidatus Marinimicrobia bacterium]|nr:universal stress protein [Candidatus Neomarinimicrobiota bacterium]
MVALLARGDEKPVVDQAVLMAEKFNAELIAIHVRKPVLSQPKGSASIRVTDKIIRDIFSDYGYGNVLDDLKIIIVKGDNISETINEHISDIKMLVVGHRKMSDFKSSIMDSTDEGITNIVACPVLVVQKD